MPTTDTWPSVAGLYQNSYAGRTKTWVRTPGFGGLPKDGKPVNVYDDLRRWAQQAQVTAYYVTGGGSPVYVYNNTLTQTGTQIETLWYSFTTGQTTWLSDVAWVQNAVKLKALGRVADAKVNLAVAYAEASKTSDLILDTAKRIDRAYRAFRKGNFREVARQLNITPKRLHKSWLEYKYGWMPLLMDVKGAAEFFAQQHVVRPTKFKVTATEKFAKDYSKATPYQAWGGAPNDAVTDESVKCTYNAKVKLWCELSNPHLSELQQLGLTNPALVAWELIPFSFVFDWFISVGNYLEGLTALNGVTVYRGMLSQIVTYEYNRHNAPTTRVIGSTTYNNGTYDFNYQYRQYRRDPYSPNPLSLYPPKTNSFSFAKLVTSLALIQGNYRGPARL